MDNEGTAQASTQRQRTLQMEDARQEHSYPPSQSTSTSQANEVHANSDINVASGDDSSGNPTPESNTNTERPLFMVPLTGYVLLILASATAFAVAKAVLALKGQSVAPTVLDLGSVVFGGVILFFIGLFERVTPPIAPWFFHDDLTVDVLCFLLHLVISAPPYGLFYVFILAAHMNVGTLSEGVWVFFFLSIFIWILAISIFLGVYATMQTFIVPRVWHAYRIRRQLHPMAYSAFSAIVFSSVLSLWLLFSPLTFNNTLEHLMFKFPGFRSPTP